MITLIANDDGDYSIETYRRNYRARIGQVHSVLANTANRFPRTLAGLKLPRR